MKAITTLLFQIIICSFLSSQGATILLDHNDSQYNSIPDPFQGGEHTKDGLLYYLATSPDDNNYSIYSTDGTVDGTVKRYNYTSFGSKLTRMEVVDSVIYAVNNDKTLYSVVEGVIEEQKKFLGQVSGIYPYNGGVIVYETVGPKQRLSYVNALEGVINDLGSFRSYDRIIPSEVFGLFIGADNSTESTTERVIISDGTEDGTMLLRDYLFEEDFGYFYSLKTAVGAGDYVLVQGNSSSNGLYNNYIIDFNTKEVYSTSVFGRFIDAKMVNDHFMMKTYETIFSYDPSTATTAIIENNETSQEPLIVVDDLLYYLTPSDTSSMKLIYTSDGTADSRKSFNGLSTREFLLIEKLGADFGMVLSDMDFKSNIFVYRADVDSLETVTNLTYSGADYTLMKVKGNLIFNKYTTEYGLELYRSEATVDNDEDGYLSDVDCDESNSEINPGAIEDDSNEIDENCDGILTGVSQTDLDDKINIYPNPVLSELNIEGINFQEYIVYLKNIDGKRLMQIKSKSENISNLHSGLYLLEFQNTEENTAIYKRVMKL